MSRIPSAVGNCAGNQDDFVTALNEAQHRLITDEAQPDEGWWGTWAVMRFNLDPTGYFTTPRDVARATAVDLCKQPVVLRNQFWEYLEFGNGLRPQMCSPCRVCEGLGAFDRGLVPTFRDMATGSKIRIFMTDETDAGKRVLVTGKDTFGNIVTSQDGFNRVTGEFVTLGAPFGQTINAWSETPWFQKDITNGQIQIHAVNDADEMTLLLTMEPTETVSGYRRYFVNGMPQGCCESGTVQVNALVKLDYIPAYVDTDYLIIGNLDALKEEVMAIRLSEMDSPTAKKVAREHHVAALRCLFGELDLYVGKERVSIQVPLWNGDKLRRQPI